MTLKEVFEKLEQIEGGDFLITSIKAETAKLRKEAELHRRKYAEYQKQKNLNQEEWDKCAREAKNSQIVVALYKGQALNPEAMVKLIADDVVATEDGGFILKHEGVEYGLDTGVDIWLKANAWAVKTTLGKCCCKRCCGR